MAEFDSPRRRLKRAIQKAYEFHLGVAAFLKTPFHTRVVEVHEGTGCRLHKVKITAFPPDELTDLAYEAVEAFRSALDHTVHACGLLSGLSGRNLEQIKFPVTKDSSAFDRTVDDSCKGLRPEFIHFFRTTAAHPGGSAALCDLNLIRRQGHHRVIVPVGTAAAVRPGLGHMSTKKPEYVPAPVWDHTNHELVFLAECPSGSFGYAFEISFSIVFGEVEGASRANVFDFLLEAGQAVEDVVNGAEALAAKLK